jgi:hypothetical protein
VYRSIHGRSGHFDGFDSYGARGRFAAKPRETLSPAYRRRLERAEVLGQSLSEARGHGTRARPTYQTSALADNPRYETALRVVSRIRHGASLTTAAKEFGIAPDTVRRYAGSALERDTRGRWTAKPADRLYRSMRFLDSRGLTTAEPASSREASKLSAYWRAVDAFIDGDLKPLRRFRRMRLRTRHKTSLRFITDPAELERLGYAGQLSYEDLYQHAA